MVAATLHGLLAAVACILGPSAGDDALDPKRCHALVVGVLEWKDGALASFAKEDRQDALLARTLIERGVPAGQVTVLLDEQATLAAIEAQLDRIAGEAGPGSTFLFYYAGHGTRAGERFCFANWDMARGNEFDVRRIATALRDRFEGERVLLFADCCHSGSLGRVVDELAGEDIDAASIASVVEENASTGNWTFTQTLVEAFAGDPTHDADGDGAIERSELELAVRHAMAARESQRSGARAGRVPASFALATVRPTDAATRFREGAPADPIALGAHVRCGERIGRVVGLAEDGGWLVRTYAYATHADAAHPRAELEPLTFEAKPVGTLVGLRLGPDLVPGRIVEIDAPFARVELPAWPEHPPEWRSCATLAPAPEGFDDSRACMVEWRGTWYPAFTLRREGDSSEWWIHYVGYGSDWDEKVGPERMREPRVPGD